MLGHRLIPADGVAAYAAYGAVRADGTPYRPEEYPSARAVQRGERVEFEPMTYRRPGGYLARIRVSSAPVEVDGRAEVVVSTFFDETARREAEEEVRRLNADL